MVILACNDVDFAELTKELSAYGLPLPSDTEWFAAFSVPVNEKENLWTVQRRYSRASTQVTNNGAKASAGRRKAGEGRIERLRRFYADNAGAEISPFEEGIL